jgi:hypothetical protein
MASNSQAIKLKEAKPIRTALQWYREAKWDAASYASDLKLLVADFAKDLISSKHGGTWPTRGEDNYLIYNILGGSNIFTFPNPAFMPKPVKNVSTARWQLSNSKLVVWDPSLICTQRLHCPNCAAGNVNVTADGWDYNPRVIKDIQGDFYLVSHKSKCTACQSYFKDSIPDVVKKLPTWVQQLLPYQLTHW